jgi:hypothetical protein
MAPDRRLGDKTARRNDRRRARRAVSVAQTAAACPASRRKWNRAYRPARQGSLNRIPPEWDLVPVSHQEIVAVIAGCFGVDTPPSRPLPRDYGLLGQKGAVLKLVTPRHDQCVP